MLELTQVSSDFIIRELKPCYFGIKIRLFKSFHEVVMSFWKKKYD